MPRRDISDDDRELCRDFVAESREVVETAEPILIELEQTCAESGEVDTSVIDTLFRAFHSMKGSGGFLELENLVAVTHQAESLLDLFRQGRATVRASHITALCHALDLTKQMLDQIEAECHDEGFEEAAREAVDRLRREMEASSGESDPAPRQPASPAEASAPGESTVRQEDSGSPSAPDEVAAAFREQATAALRRAEEALLRSESRPAGEVLDQAYVAMHELASAAALVGLDRVADAAREIESLVQRGRGDAGPEATDLVGAILGGIDRVRALIEELPDAADHASSSPAGTPDVAAPASDPPLVESPPRPEGAVGVADVPPAQPSDPAPAKPGAPSQTAGGRQPPSRGNIRVDLEKLDTLMDLVGELIIAETMVTHNPDLEGCHFENFQKAALQLNRITRALQDVAMSVRMVPIGGVFRKMLRLVRDLARKQGKHVQLVLAGEDTEVDKTVVELIADPLVHILRNAVDHGLEPSHERERAGKPPTGTIRLEARHESGEIWVVVSDDGRGLDAQAILEKAVARGLLDPSHHEPSEAEIFRCIFEPGFSTASQVTDISGRGVGMDVVRRNIEELRGRVDISSQRGSGTTITIRVPLTLAIIEGMLVRVGESRYTIPLVAIRESVSVKEQDLTRLSDGQEMVRIRGQLLPVLRLYEYHEIAPSSRNIEEGILIVVEDAGSPFGILVDEILGQRQTVIERLPEYIGGIRGVAGCSILSNGDISFILDVGSLRATWSPRR